MENIEPPTYRDLIELSMYALQIAVTAKTHVTALRMLIQEGGLVINPALYEQVREAAMADELAAMSMNSPYLAQLALAIFVEGERPVRGSSPDQTGDEIPY